MNANPIIKNNEKIFSILFNKDEVTWQSIIYNLVKNNEMNPWDINISLISSKYIEIISKLKKMDFRLSGKVLLAAAILLKIKSNKFIGADITNFENLLKTQNDDNLYLDDYIYEENLDEKLSDLDNNINDLKKPSLIPKTPQPRERKVSIFDLVEALQRALDVKQKRVLKEIPKKTKLKIPEKTRDITQIIREVFSNIKLYFLKNSEDMIEFSTLLPNNEKEDKIYTFVSLLHLTTERKIDLMQEEHLAPIFIKLASENTINDSSKILNN